MEQATANRIIRAEAAAIYDIISDYHEGHRRILPTRQFKSLDVLEGGRGAGTRIRVTMQFGSVERTFESIVSEPEPGRRLVESIPVSGTETTFTVEPLGPAETRVTISTTFEVRSGLAGRFEAYFTRRLLKQTYREELELLAQVVEEPLFTG